MLFTQSMIYDIFYKNYIWKSVSKKRNCKTIEYLYVFFLGNINKKNKQNNN